MRVLTSALMQHAIEKDTVKEVDYLIGDDPYKQSWMNQRRERWGLIAYNPRSIAGLVGSGREFIARYIKSMGLLKRSSGGQK